MMKTMLKSKKIISVLMTVVMLAVMSCTGVFAADSGEYGEADDVQEMTYLGEIDGMPTWEIKIPLIDGVARANVYCTLKVWYSGSTLYCQIIGTSDGAATFYRIKGTCNTYGPACGSTTKSFDKSLPINAGVIDTVVNFNTRPVIKNGTQYFVVNVTVYGSFGSMSSNNLKASLHVEPDMRIAK